jgi:hypothetical protein
MMETFAPLTLAIHLQGFVHLRPLIATTMTHALKTSASLVMALAGTRKKTVTTSIHARTITATGQQGNAGMTLQ